MTSVVQIKLARPVRIATIALAMTLVACASTTPTVSNTKPVPPSEVSAYQNPAASSGAVHIFRDEGFAGSAVRYVLLVDNKQTASIGIGERVTLHLPEGARYLEVRLPGTQWLAVLSESILVDVKAGNDFYFRITMDGSSIRLQRVAPSVVGAQ